MTRLLRFGHGPRASNERGLTLIELMITLVISSIVIIGLVTLVSAIGVANRTQDGLARLQENGRFAMQRIAADLRAASSQHCSSFDSASSVLAAGASSYVDQPRAIRSYFNAAAQANVRFGPTGLASPYLISTRFLMIGHECDTGACAPNLAAANRGVNQLPPAIPNMGTGVGSRARGADVITIRYLAGDGMRVVDQQGWQVGPPDAEVLLENDAAELAQTGFAGMAVNDPVWVSDCSASEMFLGTRVGATTVRLTGNPGGNEQLRRLDLRSDVRAFHLPTSLRTVSYYLQIFADPRTPGRSISSLMRKVGANAGQDLVQGVERFDLLYGIEDSLGRTRYLTAAQVDALGSVANECPPYPNDVLPLPPGGQNEPGCGWRAVKSVEVYLLVNTVDDISSSDDDEFRYSWLNNGAVNAAGTFEDPSVVGTLRNGLPPGRMLRREFRTLVNLRGYNY